MIGGAVPQMTCRELVELVTDHLEGTLSPTDRRRFEEHLELCPPCVAYLEQMRAVVRAGGRLSEESIDPAARDALMHAFRGWTARGPETA